MPQILLPHRFLAQPQYPAQLNTAHPLFGDIVLAYSAGRGLDDGKHGLGSTVGTVLSGVGQKGRYIQPGDASSYAQFADHVDYNVLGEFTVIAQIRTGGTSVQQGIVTKCETGGGANTPWALLIESGGAVALNRSNAGGGVPFRVWASAAALSANTHYVVAVSQGSDIGVAPKFYLNGVFDSGAATSLYGGAGTGAPTGNATSVKIGNRTDLASQFFGQVYDAFVFKRALSTSEIAALSSNIWSPWKAPSRRIWVATTSPDVTVALSGQAAVSSQGSLGVDTSVALSGQQVTSSAGTLIPGVGVVVALAGQSSSFAQDSLSPATGIALSGQALAFSQGTIGVVGDVTVALTGIAITASQGTISPPAPSSGGFSGPLSFGKVKSRKYRDKDRDEIRKSLLEQLEEKVEELREDVSPPEVPQAIKIQAAQIVEEYREPSIDLQSMERDIQKVRALLKSYEEEVRRRRDEEDEELLFMFL